MSRRVRIGILGPALLGLGALFAWAMAGLPAFGDYRGPYGFVLDRVVVPLRHTTNVVMGTNFDVRAVDTMGEEFILYAAIVGVTLLLRDETRSRRAERRTRRLRSDAVRLVGVVMFGGGLLVALWLIAFGYITPGGGFQGGVLLAGCDPPRLPRREPCATTGRSATSTSSTRSRGSASAGTSSSGWRRSSRGRRS